MIAFCDGSKSWSFRLYVRVSISEECDLPWILEFIIRFIPCENCNVASVMTSEGLGLFNIIIDL